MKPDGIPRALPGRRRSALSAQPSSSLRLAPPLQLSSNRAPARAPFTMPPAGSTTLVEPLSTSNRRQPARNARTQPLKYAFPGGRAPGGRASLGGAEERLQETPEPGFFPGLTHFTDVMTALPKEMSRHFTMLKEVDAKICHSEVSLEQLARNLDSAPVPVPFTEASRMMELASQINSRVNSRAASVNGAASVPMAPGPSQMSFVSQATSIDNYDIPRRQDFLTLRRFMNDMMPIMEEKNHVIATATDALTKQLLRAESSWPEIQKEISEETRLGNLHHWAYTDRTADKKDTRAERPRREAAVHHNFAAVADDFGAVRGTHKRRAQQAQIESEIEETRANKRGLGTGKGKKPAPNQAHAVGLGLSTGVTNPKKRKVEELAAGGVEMTKSLSAVFNKNGGVKGGNSPRSGSPAGAKRPRTTGNGLGVTSKGRARAGTGASAANSPHISSPVVGSTAPNQKPSASPAIGSSAMGRTSSGRGRQNSTQNHLAAPTSNPKQANGNSKPLEDGIAALSKAEIRAPRLDGTVEDVPEARAVSASKRDDSHSRSRPAPILTGTRAAGKASKNATPVNASFADPFGSSRPRSNRATGVNETTGKTSGAGSPAFGAPVKRSHKKGAGIAAQRQAELRAFQKDDQSTGEGDAADEEPGEGDEEKKYCYCNSVSYGDMVGCDGEGCEKEWFHLGCIGLDKVPLGKGECAASISGILLTS